MDFSFYPPQLTIPAGLNINITMMVRSLGLRGMTSKKVHLILTVKIKNTSAIFSYPIMLILPDNN